MKLMVWSASWFHNAVFLEVLRTEMSRRPKNPSPRPAAATSVAPSAVVTTAAPLAHAPPSSPASAVAPPRALSSAPGTLVAELRGPDALHKGGALSYDEFAVAKGVLLDLAKDRLA